MRMVYRGPEGILGWIVLQRTEGGARVLLQPGPVPPRWQDRPERWERYALALLERERPRPATEEMLQRTAERRPQHFALEDDSAPLPPGLLPAVDADTGEEAHLGAH